MDSSGSVFSKTLQDITTTKLEELAEQRHTFEEQYQQLLNATSKLPDPLERLVALVDGTKSCLGVVTTPSKDGTRGRVVVGSTSNRRLETDLKNIDRFLEQARYDPSVSLKVLENWEKLLLQYLSVQSAKYQYADLYGRLVTEWLSSEKSALSENDPKAGDSFEELPGAKKLEARSKWEEVVFEPANVDQKVLTDYLNDLFCSDKGDESKPFEDLRRKVIKFENSFTSAQQFNVPTLQWVVRSLEASDLLSNEKREVLKDFLGNNVILGEIADVLNMRMTTLNRWSWGEFVPLEERRNVNGGYSIQMHEDLLQAIFLHYIGVKWSVFFKNAFGEFRRGAWTTNSPPVPQADRLRREFYLGSNSTDTDTTLQAQRRETHLGNYFSHQLLDFEQQIANAQEGEEEAEFAAYVPDLSQKRTSSRTKQTARKSTGGLAPQMQLASMVAQKKVAPSFGAGRFLRSKSDPFPISQYFSDQCAHYALLKGTIVRMKRSAKMMPKKTSILMKRTKMTRTQRIR